jgi:hypothetical protein
MVYQQSLATLLIKEAAITPRSLNLGRRTVTKLFKGQPGQKNDITGQYADLGNQGPQPDRKFWPF